MKRQVFLKHRLQTLSTLNDAVGAMRALSAHQFRRVRQALPAAREYRGEINSIIAEIGIDQPSQAAAPLGLLLIASDLGLCGNYNSQLSQLAIGEAQNHEAQAIYSVGRRARGALTKSSLTPRRHYDAPATLEGISRILRELANDLLDDYLENRFGRLQVVSAGFEGIGHFSALSTQVLPVTTTVVAEPMPISPYADRDHLTAAAVREFLYVTLYEILLDALAAEHGMRLVAAEAALDWLDRTAASTARQLANARSEAATQELLEIVSGSHSRWHEQ